MSDPITLVGDPDGTEHVLCRVAGVECRVNGTLPASLRPALDGLMAESSPGGGVPDAADSSSSPSDGSGVVEAARDMPSVSAASWRRRFEPYRIPEWSGVDAAPVRAVVGRDMFVSIMRRLARDAGPAAGPDSSTAVRARIGIARDECLRRTMLAGLPRKRVLAVYGVCVAYDNRAYLFSGQGAGDALLPESYALQWRRWLGDGVRIIGDGWLALGVGKHGRERFAAVSPTPWNRREGWFHGVTAPLDAWCFIRAGNDGVCETRHVDPAEATDDELRNVFMPNDRIGAIAALDLLNQILQLTPTYTMALARAMADARLGDAADADAVNVGVAVIDDDIAETAARTGFEALTGMRYADRRALFAPPLTSIATAWE